MIHTSTFPMIALLAALAVACGDSASSGGDAATDAAAATDPAAATDAAAMTDAVAAADGGSTCNNPAATRWVTVSYWMTTDCSGTPMRSQRYPIDFGRTTCYCWPGHSGMNSAKNFSCNTAASEFSFEQWTDFVCGVGGTRPGTPKTISTSRCTQDVPPTLYARITDYSGCQ